MQLHFAVHNISVIKAYNKHQCQFFWFRYQGHTLVHICCEIQREQRKYAYCIIQYINILKIINKNWMHFKICIHYITLNKELLHE